ncbi:4'-phosphopantetheinyl transferase family protein [Nonomuraea antimicrobica]|uniref:4'-phosphopantetheinyl transferase family protein n=1 Tax=Nonomuraea antimicrobica TaxID=561173 RepID=UPI0031EF9C16
MPEFAGSGAFVHVSACPIGDAPIGLCVPDDLAAAGGLPAWRAAERIAARALLRSLLVVTADEEAAAAPVRGRKSGRPFLGGRPDVAVSLSHSDGWAAAAVGLRGRVGVDVQLPRPRIAPVRGGEGNQSGAGSQSVASRRPRTVASVVEAAWIWSVQEACVKATGEGLAGRPWQIPVEPGASTGRWGRLRWAAFRELFPVPVSCAWDPGAEAGS